MSGAGWAAPPDRRMHASTSRQQTSRTEMSVLPIYTGAQRGQTCEQDFTQVVLHLRARARAP
eukprot:1154401-Alexandrium_andersonii.AAC.1